MKTIKRFSVAFYLSAISLLFLLVISWYWSSFKIQNDQLVSFDGSRAYQDVITQVEMGPRTPGSEGHLKIRAWIKDQLEIAGWTVDIQETQRMGQPIFNVVAKRSPDQPAYILGAHYDTRFFADHDPDPNLQSDPVPGANDGASGVAVLLELARTLPEGSTPVWLVFFDAEDNGRIEGWDWILGSRSFAESLAAKPQGVVIVDMIGDADLNIYLEKNSDESLRAEIWSVADRLGYGQQFINKEKYSMLDDHTPFLEAGIPAVDLIDFDYPYWHTTQDTPDKVSADSLHAVGHTLWTWIVEKPR